MSVRLRPGGWGWVGVGATIVGIDGFLIRRQRRHPDRADWYATLSGVFGDAVKHPVHGRKVIAVWAVITVHLFAVLLPARFREVAGWVDPLGWVARALGAGAGPKG